MQGAMEGIRIVEVAQWWFVPAAGAVCADWGADVVKVEHPVMGDGQRGLAAVGFKSTEGDVDFMMQQSNRGKRSVGIDIATDGGRELLYRLIETADVFLTNFLPDARERLKITVEDVRKVNPNCIYVRGTGHGPKGPDAGKGGYDATAFWSRGGIAHALTPPKQETPTMQRAAFGDGIGAMTIAGGIAAALLRRERTGVAGVVDVSLLNTAMWVLSPDVVASKLVDRPGGGMPSFSRASAPNPAGNSYQTKDGRWLLLMMLQADKHWPDFCRHVGKPEWAEDPRSADGAARFKNREAIIADLDAILATKTPMQSALELHDDPQVVANGYLAEVDRGDGVRFKLVASPVQFDEQPPPVGTSPAMGVDTDEVLMELGFDMDQLLEHKASGAIF